MSSTDNPKIVDFAQRAAGSSSTSTGGNAGSGLTGSTERPPAVDAVGQVRAHAFKRVVGLVTTLFENTDDALFDLASKADNNALQASYFDGMREVRKRRQSIEARFQDTLSKAWAEFLSGRAQATKPETPETPSPGGLTLSLVDDQELEESLAVASMVAKTENRLQRTLFALNQRLATLTNLRVEDSNNPIGPASVAQLFRQAIAELQVVLEIKLIIYKLFDRFVMSGLDPVYDEINALLVHAGVLPQMRGAVVRRGTPGAPGMPGAPRAPGAAAGLPGAPGMPGQDPNLAGGGMGGVGGYYDAAAAEMQAGLYGTLRALLASRRTDDGSGGVGGVGGVGGGGGYGYEGGGGSMTVLSPTELLSALTILQTQVQSAQTAAESAQAAQQIKDELLSQAGKLRGDNKAHVSGGDEDTIDLVGMLFEYILHDRNLPAQMQALLGRLQIPFIKVALLDKHLFARRTHPARQLLDTLAEASVGWSEESDRDRRLYDKIKTIVDALLKEFEDDLGIFDRLRVDFEAFVEANKRRAELAEQRAAEATRGREKLLAARRTAAREIVQRLEGHELPDLIRNLLTRPWANYLVLVLLRQGETSEEWKSSLQFADDLIWSVGPKVDAAQRARLRAMLPDLEKRLRHGLATVAFDENDVRRLMQQLQVLYERLLGEQPSVSGGAAAATSPTLPIDVPGFELTDPQPASAGGGPAPGGDSVLSALDEEPAPATEVVDERYMQQVRDLKVGIWIEFTDAQGNTERAKLSWISPISAKYLFVNRKGLKVADKMAAQLAVELANGKATVLEEVPLFDRALDAIVERLKATHGAKGATPAAAPAQQPG